MRNLISKTRNCVSKTRDFVFKMMNFAGVSVKVTDLWTGNVSYYFILKMKILQWKMKGLQWKMKILLVNQGSSIENDG